LSGGNASAKTEASGAGIRLRLASPSLSSTSESPDMTDHQPRPSRQPSHASRPRHTLGRVLQLHQGRRFHHPPIMLIAARTLIAGGLLLVILRLRGLRLPTDGRNTRRF